MKKHKLLREDILPAMASNRKVQRLLNEFINLLSEYESNETNQDQLHHAQTTTNQLHSSAPAKYQVHSTQLVAEHIDASLQAKEIGS